MSQHMYMHTDPSIPMYRGARATKTPRKKHSTCWMHPTQRHSPPREGPAGIFGQRLHSVLLFRLQWKNLPSDLGSISTVGEGRQPRNAATPQLRQNERSDGSMPTIYVLWLLFFLTDIKYSLSKHSVRPVGASQSRDSHFRRRLLAARQTP